MKANDPNDCGHSCHDAECNGGADPLCPVHGMTEAEWVATGYVKDDNPWEKSREDAERFLAATSDMARQVAAAVANCSDCDDPRDHTWPAYSDLCGGCAERRQASWDDVDQEGYE